MGNIITKASVRIARHEDEYHTAGKKRQCPGIDGSHNFLIGLHRKIVGNIVPTAVPITMNITIQQAVRNLWV
jgi:hypothetical protein